MASAVFSSVEITAALMPNNSPAALGFGVLSRGCPLEMREFFDGRAGDELASADYDRGDLMRGNGFGQPLGSDSYQLRGSGMLKNGDEVSRDSSVIHLECAAKGVPRRFCRSGTRGMS